MPPEGREESDRRQPDGRARTGRGSRRLTVAEVIERFSPKRVPPAVWSRIEAIAREWVSRFGPETPIQAVHIMGIVTQLLFWADGEGEPLEPEVLLHPEMIERFLAVGLPNRKQSTGANYRSVLRKVGRSILGPGLFPFPTQGIPAQDPQAPYTAGEISAQQAWVGGMVTDHMRRNAMVLLALGLGAGLRADEMSRLRGTDVARDGSVVVVHVTERNIRDIPVLRSWESTVFDLSVEVGEFLVFRPDRTYVQKGQTSNFIARCAKSAGEPPAFSLARLRVTWIVDHLVAGVPPHELARAAGVRRTQMAHYFNLIPDLDPATVQRWLRDGGRQ